MSWWIGVEGAGTGPAEISRNVTYNVGGMFRLALAIVHPGNGQTGLPALHGAPCSEAAGVLAQARQRMLDDPAPCSALAPANRWGTYESALEDLAWLLARCAEHPRGSVYIH